MAAYRRVTVPQFLVAISQLGLTGIAICLCGIETREEGSAGGLWNWLEINYSIRGYPIPWQWSGYERACHRGFETVSSEEMRSEGTNLAVPVGLLTLAWCIPPVALDTFTRYRRWWRGEKQQLSARLIRYLQVVVFAVVGGLAVAQIDVLSSKSWASCVPFAHPPGEWINTPAIDRAISWLSQRRETLSSQDGRYDPKLDWAPHTELTLVGAAFALAIGCLIVRPWRRAGGSSTSDGAAATTLPPA